MFPGGKKWPCARRYLAYLAEFWCAYKVKTSGNALKYDKKKAGKDTRPPNYCFQ
jgi:hypothetical protein